MHAIANKRERLGRFVDLARVYRGWTKTELSAALHRDPTKLIPQSGNPKLDLIAGIAAALDWTIGDVAESVCQDLPSGDESYAKLSFKELDKRVLDAHRAGSTDLLISLSSEMLRRASNPTERALSLCRLYLGFESQGRYGNALKVIQQAAAEQGIPATGRINIQANLANAHYALWHLIEARAIATDLIETIENSKELGRMERSMHASALYVRGNTYRRMLAENEHDRAHICQKAIRDLNQSVLEYTELEQEYSDPRYTGIANICTGALMEVRSAEGTLCPVEAVEQLAAGLDEVIDPDAMPVGDQLESWGWWAIFGANISLRHLEGDLKHRQMAVFTNKAIEIGERLGNWAMRERAFTLEHFRRQQADLTGVEEDPWPLDDEDIRVITGTMGRFPAFREVGWEILRNARVLEND